VDDSRQYPTNNATGIVALFTAFVPVPFFSAFTHPSQPGGTSGTSSRPVATAAPTVTAAPATPASRAPTSGDVWVCRSGGGATSSTVVPSSHRQAHGYQVRVYVKPLTPYYYDQDWNKVPGGAC
jgi:hypothetical protein